jgi:ABC-type lipoprotein export system ATPase subunit
MPTVDEHELGRRFKEVEELSIGEWQEVTMARAYQMPSAEGVSQP